MVGISLLHKQAKENQGAPGCPEEGSKDSFPLACPALALREDRGVEALPAWCKPCLYQSRLSRRGLWVLDCMVTAGMHEGMGQFMGSQRKNEAEAPREGGG